MSSQINPYNIDGTYPVAGQDNNSQGFRDNFTNTKNNLVFAKTEIEDLQSKAVLKSALTGTTLDNDFSGAALSNATIKGFRSTKYDIGSTVSGSQSIDFANGSFQTFTTDGSVVISAITNWPNTASTATVLDLGITISNASHTITFPSPVTMGAVAGVSSKTITFTSPGTYFFELISIDGGSSFYLVDKTRAYNHVQGSFTVNGTLTTAGALVETGYQYANTVVSNAVTVGTTVSRLILDAGALVNLGVTLPTGNVDAKVITVSSVGAVTNLAVSGNAGTTVKPSANISLSAGSSATYFYHSSEGTWYKIG